MKNRIVEKRLKDITLRAKYGKGGYIIGYQIDALGNIGKWHRIDRFSTQTEAMGFVNNINDLGVNWHNEKQGTNRS